MATQLDPLDCLIYTALVIEAGPEFESQRVAASEEVVHSHRFLLGDNGQIYDPAFNFNSFRNVSLRLASEASVNFVALTDISDFYSRIYLHRLENAIGEATDGEHTHALLRLIKQWNMNVSYGIPVGPAASRILADVAIDDVDQALKSEGYTFCRYSDDYRFFVRTERESREAVAFLANTLYHNHGLTLQASKTEILPAQVFVEKFQFSEEDIEAQKLGTTFGELLQDHGNPYEQIDWDDLRVEVQEAIREINLWEVLKDELAFTEGRLNFRLAVFVLRQIAQLGIPEPEPILIPNIRRLYPVLKHVVSVLESQRPLDSERRASIGTELLSLMDHEVIGFLEYHREWILKPFGDDIGWNHTPELVRMFSEAQDTFTKRGIVLALGRQGAAYWFKPRKVSVFDLPPWERRAFLYGASCLPGDESVHWYGSLKSRLDELETAVYRFASHR